MLLSNVNELVNGQGSSDKYLAGMTNREQSSGIKSGERQRHTTLRREIDHTFCRSLTGCVNLARDRIEAIKDRVNL